MNCWFVSNHEVLLSLILNYYDMELTCCKACFQYFNPLQSQISDSEIVLTDVQELCWKFRMNAATFSSIRTELSAVTRSTDSHKFGVGTRITSLLSATITVIFFILFILSCD